MNELVLLKEDIVKAIKEDAVLYGKVAQALGIGAPSLRPLLKANHAKLTQAGVLIVLLEHLAPNENKVSWDMVSFLNLIDVTEKQ